MPLCWDWKPAQASPSREALYASFADGEEMLARLCLLGAGAPPLLQALAQHLELLDMLFDPDEMQTPATREELTERVQGRLRVAKTPEQRLRALGAFWRRERLRVGARDLWGETADVGTTGEELTDLAEAMLEGLLVVAAERAGREAVLPRMAVIGLGKFGGRELNYPSDGDLLYIHERPEDSEGVIAVAESLRVVMQALRTGEGVIWSSIRACARWAFRPVVADAGRLCPLLSGGVRDLGKADPAQSAARGREMGQSLNGTWGSSARSSSRHR
jgi:glutamate-ammonia-ligase adenylyltransferase